MCDNCAYEDEYQNEYFDEGPEMAKFTIRRLFKAAKNSSVPLRHGNWGDTTSACILGRAVLGLKTDRDSIVNALDGIQRNLGNDIMSFNDSPIHAEEDTVCNHGFASSESKLCYGDMPIRFHTLEEIVAFTSERLEPYFEKEIELPIYDEGRL